MGMTIIEKIMARHSGREKVASGDYVTARIDQVCMYDSFIDIHEDMKRAGIEGGLSRVWDKDRVVVLIDHKSPAVDRNVTAAKEHVAIRRLVKNLGLPHFFDVKAGICHQIMAERGFALPGSLVVVPDSHTLLYGALNCGGTGIGETEMAWVLSFGELWFKVPSSLRIEVSGTLRKGVMAKDVFLHLSGNYGTDMGLYRSIEWTGKGMESLSIDERLSLAVQSTELGAKFSLFRADQKLMDYIRPRAVRSFEPVLPDPNAEYEKVYRVNASELQPLVAKPHGMDEVGPVGDFRDVAIDQAVIGGCTNGRLEDLGLAARILEGRRVHPDVRLIVGPASWEIYKAAMKAGFLESLIDAGGIVCHPHCGPCTGRMGTLAPEETCITSTSRNFKGRMGSPEANIYLASPATVAASAVKGHISDPREVL